MLPESVQDAVGVGIDPGYPQLRDAGLRDREQFLLQRIQPDQRLARGLGYNTLAFPLGAGSKTTTTAEGTANGKDTKETEGHTDKEWCLFIDIWPSTEKEA